MAAQKTQPQWKLSGLTNAREREEQMNSPFLFLSITAVSLCSFTAVVIWAKERRREREAFYTGETVRKLAELQGPNVSAAVEFFRTEEKNLAVRRWRGLKSEACFRPQLASA